MNSLIKSFIILIILILNNINCLTIKFNNDIATSCTSSNPCDLSSKLIWVNNQVPGSGDDVVIDLSSLTLNTSIYLSADSLDVQLNSFTLNGQQISNYKYQTSLFISNSNLTISTNFNISNSNFTLLDTLDGNMVQIFNFNSNNNNIVIDGNSNLEFGSIYLNGQDIAFIKGDSIVSINSTALLFNPLTHTSNGLLKFGGSTSISEMFYSQGQVEFDGQVEFAVESSPSTIILNTTLVGGQIKITSKPVIIVNYIQLNPSASIMLLEGSSLSVLDSINSKYSLTNEILILEGSTLFIPAGYEIYNSNIQMAGTIFIGSTESQDDTFFISVQQPTLNISSQSNITLVSSLLNSVSLMGYPNSLNIQGSSDINTLLNHAITNITANSSLTINNQKSTSSISSAIYNSGHLKINGNISSAIIYNNPSGVITSNGDIQISPYANLELYENSITSNIFTMVSSTLQLKNVALNSLVPFITSNYITMDSIYLTLEMADDKVLPSNNDKILLFSTNGNQLLSNQDDNQKLSSGSFNITTKSITISTLSNSTDYSTLIFKIEQDSSGNVILVFYESSEESNHKELIYGIIFGTFGLLILIVIILIIVRKRTHQDHKNNQNKHEIESLLNH